MKRLMLIIGIAILGVGALAAFSPSVSAQQQGPAYPHLPAQCNDNPNTSAFCQTCDQLHVVDGEACKNPKDNFNSVVKGIVQTLIIVVAAISVIAIVTGGFVYAFSQGEASHIKRAKDIILYAVIGLLVAMAAQAIVIFVIGRI